MKFIKIIHKVIFYIKKTSLITILFVTSVSVENSYAVDVLKKGHYLKVFYSYFGNTTYFNNNREKQVFDYNGKGLFQKINLEYRYGISNRFNFGFSLPWISNSFENKFSETKRNSITDISLITEYRFLDLPSILTLRGELKVPLNYKTNQNQLYIGNGTTDILMGVIFKQFFTIPLERNYTNLWFEIEAAINVPLNNDPGNIDGDYAVPLRGSINYRPLHDLTIIGGFIGSINDDRDFLALELIFKYRLTTAIEFEIGITDIFSGRNSSRGLYIFGGLSINTNKVWY